MNRIFQHGEIYRVDFDPSVGHEFQKQRPAIIIQSDETLSKTRLITVMAITSNIKGKQNDDIVIKKDEANNLLWILSSKFRRSMRSTNHDSSER